ncbi:MAG: MEKHLA domain-containing protein [Cyanobacteriota bacterium]|jgi:hypothetical protein
MAEAPWLEPGAQRLAGLILRCHQHAFRQPLLACGPDRSERQQAQELFAAAAVVMAHDGASDPCLIYANRSALRLWRRPWSAQVGMPSRLTAEPAERRARSAALLQALEQDAIRDYAGIRVDSEGRRFRIEGARLWTLWDGAGQRCGQAASFDNWWWL